MDSLDYEFIKKIGRGRYSRIYEVKRLENGGNPCHYAAKLFTRLNHRSWERFHREHYFLQRISSARERSPLIVTLYQTLKFRHYPVFMMSEGCGDDLLDLVIQVGRMSEDQAKFFACEIICGLEHIHSMDIVHCDIKPENVLLTYSGHIMITGFDLACDLSEGEKAEYKAYAGGTHGYQAPEVMEGIACNEKADVWSMAAVIADLVSPHRLNEENEKKKLKPGQWNKRFLDDFSLPFQLFFYLCFERYYQHRPSIKEVKKCDFFECVNWEHVKALQLTPPFIRTGDCNAPSMSQSRNTEQDSIVGKGRRKSEESNSSETSSSLNDEFWKNLFENDTIARSPSPFFDDDGEWVVYTKKLSPDSTPQKKSPKQMILRRPFGDQSESHLETGLEAYSS